MYNKNNFKLPKGDTAMKIITVSRQFGSGGRELGRKLAEKLGFDYYDQEIIKMIANNKELDADYVEKTLEEGGWQTAPLSYGCSLDGVVAVQNIQTDIIAEEQRVLDEIARLGRDCVVVGRNADAFLCQEQLLKIFVCATINSRVDRCMKHLRPEEKNLTRKKMERKIRKVDRNRVRTAEFFSESGWGNPENYNVVVNTTGWEIDELSSVVAEFSNKWFDKTEKKQ